MSRHGAVDEQIRAFLHRFPRVHFAHATEIRSLLANRDPSVRVDVIEGRLCPEVRAGYRRRAEGLASRTLPPSYPSSLPDDVGQLADAFESEADQPLRCWRIARRDGTTYVVFELVDAGRIAGAIQSADQRIAGSPDLKAMMLKMGTKPFDFED